MTQACQTRGLGLEFNVCCFFLLQRGGVTSPGTMLLHRVEKPGHPRSQMREGIQGIALGQKMWEGGHIAISAANPNSGSGVQGGGHREPLLLCIYEHNPSRAVLWSDQGCGTLAREQQLSTSLDEEEIILPTAGDSVDSWFSQPRLLSYAAAIPRLPTSPYSS